jgi:hypothetical protein
MDDTVTLHRTCGGCGEPLAGTATICPRCGWDATTSVTVRPPRSIATRLAAGGWRLLLYGLILVVPLLGFLRLRTTGPGPDLATTLAWMVTGDDGRAAELVTIHRAHEIATAAARWGVEKLEPASFDHGWAERLAPYATMHVRGWIPMLFFMADTQMAPADVRELYRVAAEDGWGRPYRVATRMLVGGPETPTDPQVAEDLADPLQESFFRVGRPDLTTGEWLRLELVSAGRDGAFDSADDLVLTSYVPAGLTLHLREHPADLSRYREAEFARGRHYFRLTGSRYDLIDARILAEFRLDTAS